MVRVLDGLGVGWFGRGVGLRVILFYGHFVKRVMVFIKMISRFYLSVV